MTSHDVRLARVQRLLRERAAPRRRRLPKDAAYYRQNVTYLFARGFFTRQLLLVICAGIFASAASVVLPASLPPLLRVPVTCVLLIGAVLLRDDIWHRIGDTVESAWRILFGVAAVVTVAALYIVTVSPNGSIVQTVRFASDEWIAERRVALDRRAKARGVVIDSAAADGGTWRLMVEDGMLRRGTLVEARAWCAALGPGWRLPDGGIQPPRPSWPTLPRPVYAWTSGGAMMQIGTGDRPQVWVSGSGRDTETSAVLCLQDVQP